MSSLNSPAFLSVFVSIVYTSREESLDHDRSWYCFEILSIDQSWLTRRLKIRHLRVHLSSTQCSSKTLQRTGRVHWPVKRKQNVLINYILETIYKSEHWKHRLPPARPVASWPRKKRTVSQLGVQKQILKLETPKKTVWCKFEYVPQ